MYIYKIKNLTYLDIRKINLSLFYKNIIYDLIIILIFIYYKIFFYIFNLFIITKIFFIYL